MQPPPTPPGEWRIKRPNTRAVDTAKMDGVAHFYAEESPDAALCGVASSSSRATLTGERLPAHYYCPDCCRVAERLGG